MANAGSTTSPLPGKTTDCVGRVFQEFASCAGMPRRQQKAYGWIYGDSMTAISLRNRGRAVSGTSESTNCLVFFSLHLDILTNTTKHQIIQVRGSATNPVHCALTIALQPRIYLGRSLTPQSSGWGVFVSPLHGKAPPNRRGFLLSSLGSERQIRVIDFDFVVLWFLSLATAIEQDEFVD